MLCVQSVPQVEPVTNNESASVSLHCVFLVTLIVFFLKSATQTDTVSFLRCITSWLHGTFVAGANTGSRNSWWWWWWTSSARCGTDGKVTERAGCCSAELRCLW